MRKISIVKRKDALIVENKIKSDSKAIKTPKITLKTWLSESINEINKRKQSEMSAFFG